MLKKYTYIFGHRNPDTDSICSSIAYQKLKRRMGATNVKAARLGNINKETAFALNYFNVSPPDLIQSIKPQVADLNLTNTVVIHESESVKIALELIVNQIGRSIPVVDQRQRLIGIVSISDIAPIYLGGMGKSILKETKTPYKNILELVNGKVISGSPRSQAVKGHIYMTSEIHHLELKNDDIIILNYDELTNIHTLKEAGCLIVCNGEKLNDLSILDAYDGYVIATPFSMFEVVQMIEHAIPVAAVVNKENLEYFVVNESLEDVKEDMLTSKFRRFPVVDEKGVIMGMISRSNFIEVNRKKAILVDHNEVSQSIKGIEDAEIIEVIDHHRVANIQTMAPLYFRTEPLGCTSTIIAKMYEENEIEIDKQIAGIMLSAIISDTLLFKSPTCTEEDRQMGYKLAEIAGVNLKTYGMEMITAGTSLEDETPDSMIKKDLKQFMFGDYKVLIAQLNTGDYEGFYKIFDEVIGAMNQMCEHEDADLFVLMVTNIVVGGSEIIPVGKARWIAENAFGMSKEDKSVFLPNVFSRKKQIVPKLMNYARL